MQPFPRRLALLWLLYADPVSQRIGSRVCMLIAGTRSSLWGCKCARMYLQMSGLLGWMCVPSLLSAAASFTVAFRIIKLRIISDSGPIKVGNAFY
jgi:hypothetical protein